MNNNKHNKVFDLKLFKQILKIAAPINILFFCIFMLITIITPIGEALAITEYTGQTLNNTPEIVKYSESFFHYIFIYTLYIPAITLYVFSFMTKRNASDYFYSFPFTRTCLFVTNIAVIITSLIATLGINTLTGIIIYKSFSNHFIIDIPSILTFTLSIFLCSLLVLAAIILACSITGTLFTNVIVTGIILFLPRFLISLLCLFITQANPMLDSNHLHKLLSSDINIVFSTPLRIIGDGKTDFLSTSTNIYSLVLAIIYLIIGYFLFKNRKSETAGTPSSSKKMQYLIRFTIGLPFSFISIAVAADLLFHENEMIPLNIFKIIVGYIVTFVGISIYELISSKKIRNILRCFPTLVLIVIVNIGLLFSIKTVHSIMNNYTPDPEKIEYIKFENDYEYDSYFRHILKHSEITDKEIIKLVAEAYEATKENTDLLYVRNYRFVQVCFKDGLSEKIRNIAIKNEIYQKINELLAISPDMINNYRILPKSVSSSSVSVNNLTLTEEESELIYETLSEELKTVDTEYFMESLPHDYNDMCINFTVTDNDVSNDVYIPLNKYTPKSLQTLIYICNKNFANTYTNTSGLTAALDSTVNNKYFDSSQMIEYYIELSYYDPVTYTLLEQKDYSCYNFEELSYVFTDEDISIFESIKSAIENPAEISLEDLKENQMLVSLDVSYYDYSEEAKYINSQMFSIFMVLDK